MACYTKDIGMRDFYKFYKENSIKKNKPYVDYKTYSKLLREINLNIREKIVYQSETFVLPYKQGELYVHKFKNHYSETNKRNWKVDYKATKEQGRIVYHGAPYGYKFKWFKKYAMLNGKKWYSFKPCRTASRMIADAVKNKQLDYYN